MISIHLVIFGNGKKHVRDWVLNRAPEFYYADIDRVLERAQIKEYDAYALFKYNEGKVVGDWFVCPMIKGNRVHTVSDERGKEWYKMDDLGNPPILICEGGWWNENDFTKP